MGGMVVAVGGTAVAVGGTLVTVGGWVVAVGGTFVAVGGTAVTVGWGVPPMSLQVTPFKAKSSGMRTSPLWLAWKPKLDVPPLAANFPFQLPAGLDTATELPELLKVAFQPLSRVSLPSNIQVKV